MVREKKEKKQKKSTVDYPKIDECNCGCSDNSCGCSCGPAWKA